MFSLMFKQSFNLKHFPQLIQTKHNQICIHISEWYEFLKDVSVVFNPVFTLHICQDAD